MRSIAYLSDCKSIPDQTRALLMDIDILIIDALRYREHPTHLSVSESIIVAEELRAGETWFTHISHDLGHAEVEAVLPQKIRVAYDGLVLRLE